MRLSQLRFLIPPLLLGAAAAASAPTAPALPLIPYPRQVATVAGQLHLRRWIRIDVASGRADDRFAAGTLVSDLNSIDHVHASMVRSSARAQIVLARARTPFGRFLLRQAGSSLPAAARGEGYVLVVNSRRAVVVAASSAGLFYGVQTLRQLIHPAGHSTATLPLTLIRDWPATRWRGVQFDLSRGPIPTVTSLKHAIARLAAFKVNALMLYFETSFEYPDLPLANPPGGALNSAETEELDAFAQRYHVTLIPEQEAFGHLHLALQYERYQDLAEVPYGDVLSPAAPGSLEFIGKMFAGLIPAFPHSPFVNIGADEVFQLGEGRTAALVASQGSGQVYLGYIRAIDEMLRPYHKRVMFWGDIAYRYPQLLRQLPHGMVALPWEYGVHKSYDRWIEPFRALGMETWVSPGVWNWSHIYPDYNLALPNIRRFIRDGRRLGCDGVLNTVWMDDGESMVNFTWYGLVYGAAASWQESINDQDFSRAWDWAFYRADGHNFAADVAKLTAIQALMKQSVQVGGDDWTTWLHPFTPRGDAFYLRLAPAAHPMRLLAEDVLTDLIEHRGEARQNASLLDWMAFSARRFDLLGQKAIYTQVIGQLYAQAKAESEGRPLSPPPPAGAPTPSVGALLNRIDGVDGLLQDMLERTTALRGAYKRLWLEQNQPYFLPNILARYDSEARYWEGQIQRFNDIGADYRSTHQLPPLEETGTN